VATNKPTGDNARKGAVKKRTQVKTKLAGASAWTKRGKKSGVHGCEETGEKDQSCEKVQGRAKGEGALAYAG
jgi:hypothetical protein